MYGLQIDDLDYELSSQDLNMKVQRRRNQPSSYYMDPQSKDELLTHHTGVLHGDEEGLLGESPLRQGTGKSFRSLLI